MKAIKAIKSEIRNTNDQSVYPNMSLRKAESLAAISIIDY